MRTVHLNILGSNGEQLAAGTPIATLVYSDAPVESRPYHAGQVEENGRLMLRFEGNDPADGTGMNVEILAVHGCASWKGRGVLTGAELVWDQQACDSLSEDGHAIYLEEGSNPFA